MIRPLPFIFVLLFLSACTLSPSQDSDRTPSLTLSRDCTSFKEGRGIVVDFIDRAPPADIHEGQPFSVALKFANHHRDAIPVEFQVTDTTDAPGFLDYDGTAVIDGAAYQERTVSYGDEATTQRTFASPGCRILDWGNYIERDLGTFTYTSVPFDHDVTYLLDMTYDYRSEISATFDLCNPSTGIFGCSADETLTGETRLGEGTRFDPVTITSLHKILVGTSSPTAFDVGQVLVQLDLTLQNLGGGSIPSQGAQTLELVLTSLDDLPFSCTSTTMLSGSRAGSAVSLSLKDGRAEVSCRALVSLDRPQSTTVVFDLTYPYHYRVQSRPVHLYRSTDSIF